MKQICFGKSLHRLWLFLAVVLLGAGLPSKTFGAGHITSPKEFLDHNIGDDYFLANYTQLTNYWLKLAKESSRLKVVSIGTTEEGRPQFVGIVTSPANQRKLSHYQDIDRRLALAENVSEAEARKLSAEGKVVVWIDGGLHASEVLGAQQLMETLYQFVSANDEETKRILDDVIIIFVHANPDGMDLCSDWYMRDPDPTKRSLGGLPRLYEKYAGHDDNRDFYASNLAETRNMNRLMYHEWLPQIVYNHHQTGPLGTVMFAPPFRDPANYNIDPLVTSGIDAVGAAMMQRFLEEGKPGVTVRSGSRYSTWWNGGLRTACYFHNMIGLLTETIGSPTPMQIQFNPAQQLPKADYLSPIAPQTWHFRQSIDYSVTANKAVLDYASRYRQQLLFNAWLMGHNAIERGSRDSWTITPKLVAANTNTPAGRGGRGGRGARGIASTVETNVIAGDAAAPGSRGGGARGARGGRGGGGTNEFNRLFRNPDNRDPRGYIISADQPDFLTATKFVNKLIVTGVKVERAKTDFEVAGKHYPAGSFVMKSAQAFRAHLLDMFEPQDHPNDFPYPGAPPTPPYDIAGWTLAYQMAVKFDRVLDGFTLDKSGFEEIKDVLPPPPGSVENGGEAKGFFLDVRVNDSFRAVNRLLAASEEVRRLQEPFETRPAGTFFTSRKATTLPLLEKIARELGTRFVGSATDPGSKAVALKPVRIGLWDSYSGSIPSGWTRYLLERFEFPFQVVYAPDLDKGNLRERFDVLIFPDGGIPARGGGGGGGGGAGVGGGDLGGDLPPVERADTTSTNQTNVPDQFRSRRGSVTVATTVPQLRKFLEDGGTILTIGNSTSLGYHLGLPLANHLAEPDDQGRERPLPREKFYVPGSLLRVSVDTTDSLAWGLEENADVMFSAGSPAFRLLDGAETNGVRRVAWYNNKTPLRSGWAWGQSYLENGVAIAEAKVGNGKLVLFGPEILFRGQPHGTFKFLFNGIVQAGVKESHGEASGRIPPDAGKISLQVGGQELELFTYKPANYKNGPLIVVFHGMLRNADTYRDNARGLADRLGAIVVAPLFDTDRFPNEAYQLGGIMKQRKVQPADQWTAGLVPKIADAVRKREGRPDMPYYLIGHSAGGQFLSRVTGFVATGAQRIMAANPGSDLFPTRDMPFPYGFGNLPDELSNDAALQRYLAQPLTLYVGTADTGTAELPMGELAMQQGPNRYERGKKCFQMAQDLAKEKGWQFNWRLVEAPGVGHDAKTMFNHERSTEALFGEKPVERSMAN